MTEVAGFDVVFDAIAAEMPLTPKGYCDFCVLQMLYRDGDDEAEMPLTPKGYCDSTLKTGLD